MTTPDLITTVREAFGWDAEIRVSPGRRGALGQIWRLDVGLERYALKEIFAEPPSEALIEAELAFTRRAAEAGVRFPVSHPDCTGHHLLAAPCGGWLRLYDWVDLRPLDLTAQVTPRDLGILLARLHSCAAVAATEPGGGEPDRWYDTVPDAHRWEQAAGSDASWAARLADCLTILPALSESVVRADPDELIVCHRDLHPENVLANPEGALVVVDWDNLGPADPARELARALFDWFCDPTPDLPAMRAMYEEYVREGGPGRVTDQTDFSMLVASRLNFLLAQTTIATDTQAEPRHREWAEREIEEALRILPTPEQLADVLAMTQALR